MTQFNCNPQPFGRAFAWVVASIVLCAGIFATDASADDEGGNGPSLSINDVTVTEGATANFTVSLSATPTRQVTVTVSTQDDTARAGSDYTATSRALTFAAGTTTLTQTFSVSTLNDTTVENTESFRVNLSNASGASIARQRGIGTILDNDRPSLSINDVTVTEGGTANFTVTLSARPTSQVTVNVATANGTATAGSDYTAVTRTLTFSAGTETLTRTVSVSTINDNVAEPTETFTVNLSGATNATIARAQGVGTILDNDRAQPSVSVNDVTVTEGGTANFAVTLSATPTSQVTVNVATANGTATAGSDYTAVTRTLTFAAGTSTLTQTVAVATINDTIAEPTETFTVNLSGATNATIARAQGTGTILDNDQAQAQPSLSVNDVTVAEGGTATFSVTLSAASSQAVTVNFATANGTASAGSDYTAATGSLSFPAGTTSRTISVVTLADTLIEQTETFTVNLSGAVNATIARAQGTGSITDASTTRPNVSINSTSTNRSSIPAASVPEQSVVNLANFQVLAVNDLGMHCGDLDTRVMSILPPFNVVHAQVVQKGALPARLGSTQVFLQYSAASNPNDPVLTNPNAILDPGFKGVFKTNFWNTARGAFDPFYPPGILPLFYPLTLDIVDLGLPVPDVERLFLGDKALAANQQSMASETSRTPAQGYAPLAARTNNPYVSNTNQRIQQFVGTQPFFVNFPFGYTSTVNWFEAAGIPIATFDDFGRENAYPMMRVQAVAAAGNTLGVAAGTVLSTVDTVLPVSGEANCAACHGAAVDGGNGAGIARLGSNVAASIDDPLHGSLPNPVSVEWAADTNILRVHDIKHNTTLESKKPVVCQTCHYTPALDLAHAGPADTTNGRQQSTHKSMSNVIHAGHASVTGTNGIPLFPAMPAPAGRNPATAQQVLEQTCYMCHPGKRAQCLRGTMGQAGVVCQDCHGNLAQVGSDFSNNKPAGNFVVAGDFYTNPNTPRVPWANEPGCGSCHTGDVLSNLTATANVVPASVNNPSDTVRLLQAYRTNDTKATPIVPTNKRFAEDVATTSSGNANPKLYRISTGGANVTVGTAAVGKTGHGGLFCESCHGPTHGEWPLANPNANDNRTASQLQGHTGTIIECGTCHGTTMNTTVTLGGPHGIHPVGNQSGNRFVDGGHENLAQSNRDSCRACHGSRGEGTVLSKTKAQRTLGGRTVAAGTPVNCGMCHGNPL